MAQATDQILDHSRFTYWTGTDLRRLRTHHKWTQEHFAKQVLGVSRATLNGWENSTDPLPRLVRLAMIGAVSSGQVLGAAHE